MFSGISLSWWLKLPQNWRLQKGDFFQVPEIVFVVTHVMYFFNFSFLLMTVNRHAINP